MSKYREIADALEVLKADKKHYISIDDFEDPDKFLDILTNLYIDKFSNSYDERIRVSRTPIGITDIIVHPHKYTTIRMWNGTIFDQQTKREVLLTGNFGTLAGASVRMSHLISENEIYVILENDKLLKIIIGEADAAN